MKAIGIIPVRYDSKRLPGKALIHIKGKSIVQRVYEQAKKCVNLQEVFIATDHSQIQKHVHSFGGKVIPTTKDHKCGTDRCIEAAQNINDISDTDIILNIQGDEAFLEPEQLSQLIDSFKNPEVNISTLITAIKNHGDIDNPNIVKAILDKDFNAIYFSRLPIPYQGESKLKQTNHKHIGIYAFRYKTLKEIAKLKPSKLEMSEKLEQLRWLENGLKIKCLYTKFDNCAINTKEDLEKIINKI